MANNTINVEELIQSYEDMGIHLYLDNDKLKFKAPVGTMTAERKQELKKYKEMLITYLRYEDEEIPVSDTDNRFSIFPLTNIQAAYLTGRGQNYSYGGVSCHAYGEVMLPKVDKDRMEEAFHRVILRHDMLRAVVFQEGYQQVLKEVELPELKSVICDSETEFEQVSMKVRQDLMYKQYELGQFPMYEICLTSCGDKTIMHFSIDMLLADFPSVNVILNDLMTFYGDPDIEMPEPDITFRDILLFRQSRKNSKRGKEKYEQDKAYWLDRVEDFPHAPQLPANGKPVGSEIIQFNKLIDREQKERLVRRAGKNHITPSALILAAYAQVIARWSDTERFALNITKMDRPQVHPQMSQIVGDFTDVIVLESDFSENLSFIGNAKKLQNRLWSDLEHSSYSGIDFLRELNRRRKEPMIVPIVYTSTLGVENAAAEKKYELVYEISQTPQVWIDCQVSERNGGIYINWDVRKGIFEEHVIKAMFEALSKLIDELAENDAIYQKTNPVGLPEKMADVRRQVNDTNKDIPASTLLDGFLNAVNHTPDKAAVIYGDRTYSYKELYNRACCYGAALKKEGFSKNALCAISCPKSFEQIAGVLGVLMAGGAYVPMLDSQPVSRKKKILEKGNIQYIITYNEPADYGMEDLIAIDPDELTNEADNYEVVMPTPEDVAYIIFTSGSTGTPKGVIITHQSAMNTILDINSRFEIKEKDAAIGIAELSFDLSVYDIFGMFAAGGTLVLPRDSENHNAQRWIELIKTNSVTVWNTVPAHMQMLCSAAEYAKETLDLKKVLLSGDWIPLDLPAKIRGIAPHADLYSLGGATEAAIWSIYYPIGENNPFENSIPYGYPLANQFFRILNENGEDQPDSVPGELYIGGAGVAVGYLNDAAQTNSHFIDIDGSGILYRTGDYGKYHEDGTIEFLGRRDNQIKRHGHRIELNEIEHIIENLNDVEQAAVIISTNDNEDHLAAFATAATGADTKKYEGLDNLLNKTAVDTGDSISGKYDNVLLKQWIRNTDTAALLNIVDAFKCKGLFKDKTTAYSYEEISQTLEVLPKFQPLLRRMVNALEAEGFIVPVSVPDTYVLTDKIDSYDVESFKEQMRLTEEKIKNNSVLIDYLSNDGSLMTKLFNGEKEPLEFIYPKGSVENALSAYRDNIFVKTLNGAIIKSIETAVDELSKKKGDVPVRILEPGAGVGGTSRDLITNLSSKNIEYHFTDISAFFLNEAKKVFSDYDFIKYQIFDINKSYLQQNYKQNTFDIIICANVLHNAADGAKTLKALSEMLVPNGYLFIIDCVNESPSLLTSMSFEYTMPLKDYRAAESAVYFTYPHWMENFDASSLKKVCDYPDADTAVGMSGQHIFILRKSSDRKELSESDIIEHCKKNLPDYMVPDRAEVLDRMPFTGNGKLDRKALAERVVGTSHKEHSENELPTGETEKKLEKIWKEVLGISSVSRFDDFYSVGGDSLLITQLVIRMRNEMSELQNMEWNELLELIMRHPTIESLAKSIDSHERAEINTDPYEILKAPETNCTGEIVLFADGTGTTGIYSDIIPLLKSHLKNRIQLSCFHVADAEHYLTFSVEELIVKLGEEYAERLTKSGENNFYLVGHCFGGLVAMETARCLNQKGMNTQVVMIDSKTCNNFEKNRLLLERGFGHLLHADAAKAGHVADETLLKKAIGEYIDNYGEFPTEEALCNLDGEIGKCYRELRQIPVRERMKMLCAALPDRHGEVSEFELERVTAFYDVFCHSYESVSRYEPVTYTAKLTMLKCKDQRMSFLPIDNVDSSAFINGVTENHAKVIDIDGDHVSCMFGNNGKMVSNIIIGLFGGECFA